MGNEPLLGLFIKMTSKVYVAGWFSLRRREDVNMVSPPFVVLLVPSQIQY